MGGAAGTAVPKSVPARLRTGERWFEYISPHLFFHNDIVLVRMKYCYFKNIPSVCFVQKV